MNRKYSSKYYLDLVEKVRKAMPDIALSTDIPRFPGENEEDFEATLRIAKSKGTILHLPSYTHPERYPRCKKKGSGSGGAKKQRLARLNELINGICMEKTRSIWGRLKKFL